MATKTNQPRRRVNWRNAHNAQTIGLVQKRNKLAIKAYFTDGLLHPSNPPPPHLHVRSAKSHSQAVLPWTATRRKKAIKNVTILSSTRNKRPKEQEQLNQELYTICCANTRAEEMMTMTTIQKKHAMREIALLRLAKTVIILVSCEDCENWFHSVCVGLGDRTEEELNTIDCICDDCCT